MERVRRTVTVRQTATGQGSRMGMVQQTAMDQGLRTAMVQEKVTVRG
jgi:hypothetical protein